MTALWDRCPVCQGKGWVYALNDEFSEPCPACLAHADAIKSALEAEREFAASLFDKVANEANCRIEHGVDGLAGEHVKYFEERCRREAAVIRARGTHAK